MRFILLTLTMLISLSSSALDIELREVDFSRCPEIKEHLAELMKTVNSDLRKLRLSGSNCFFVRINGMDVDDLYFKVEWYDSEYYIDHVARYHGYTVIGKDTILITLSDLADSLRDKIRFYKRKKKIHFTAFPPGLLAKKFDFKKVTWERDDADKPTSYEYYVQDVREYDDSCAAPYHNVTR